MAIRVIYDILLNIVFYIVCNTTDVIHMSFPNVFVKGCCILFKVSIITVVIYI